MAHVQIAIGLFALGAAGWGLWSVAADFRRSFKSVMAAIAEYEARTGDKIL